MNKEVNIYFKVEGLDGYIQNLDDLKSALGDVEGATQEVTDATKKMEEAVEQDFSKLEGRLETTEGAVKVLAGSFEMLAGAASLLGVEDNEFFQKLEENVVGVIALAEGAVNVAEGMTLLKKNTELATIAKKAFNAVAKANPYVLLASAVVALAGAVLLFKTRAAAAAKEQKRLREEHEKYELSIKGEAEATLEAYNAKKQYEAVTKEVSSLTDEEIKSRIDQQKQLEESAKSAVDAAAEELAEMTRRNQLIGKGFVSIGYVEKAQNRYNEALAAFNKVSSTSNEYIGVYNDELDRRNDALEENTAATLENTEAIEDNYEALEDYVSNQAILLQSDLQAWRDYYDERYQQEYDWNMQYDQFIADRMDADERDRANKQRLAQLEENRDRMLQDSKFALAEATVEAGRFAATMIERFGKDEERAAKAAFIVNKLASIADVIVQYQKAKIGLLASSSVLPPVAREAYLAKSLLAAKISAGISLATIAATKFEGGGGSLDNGSSQSAGVNPAASINYSFGQQAGETIGVGQSSTGQQQAPVQTYVLASDVTSAQQAQQQIQNLSRL